MAGTSATGVVCSVVISMRPKQWTKNLIVLAPVIFSGRLGDPVALGAALLAFVAFCLLSGAVYLVNDVRDFERDRLHARKRSRPIASGVLAPGLAIGAAALAMTVALAVSLLLTTQFVIVAISFVALQVAYTFGLKHAVILDVMIISAGFVLRIAAGTAAIEVPASPWLYMCAALLALFLGLGKRRHELLLLEEQAGDHRAVLDDYSPQLLDALLATVTAATIVTYSLYTFFSPSAEQHNLLMLTIPFVVYGVFRYLYLMYKLNLGGSPEEILLTDAPLITTILGWLVASGAVIYFA